jgi:hypothetical protein
MMYPAIYVGMSVERIRESGYTLLADYLAQAPEENRYSRQLEQCGVRSFLDNSMLNGEFFNALLDDDLGKAVMNVDTSDARVLYQLIKYSDKYGVSDIYTKRTIPQSAYEKLERIAKGETNRK